MWYGIVYSTTVTTVATGQATYTRHCISHPPSELQRVYYEYFGENWPMLLWHNIIRKCGSLITWFCSQTRAKPGNQTATSTWHNPYCLSYLYMKQNNIPLLKSFCQHKTPGYIASAGVLQGYHLQPITMPASYRPCEWLPLWNTYKFILIFQGATFLTKIWY